MAEFADVEAGTIVSKELSDPIRSHKDIHKDAVDIEFYHKDVDFCKDVTKQLVGERWLCVIMIPIIFYFDPVTIVVMWVGILVMTDGIADDIKMSAALDRFPLS